MPLPIDTTGSDLKSIHGPSALVELASRMQLVELSQPEATRPNNVQISSDQEAQTITVSMTLPVTASINAAGRPEFNADPYMVAPFVAGTGTLKSDNYPDAALELGMFLSSYELSLPAENRPDRIQFSLIDGTATITFSTPATVTLDTAGRTVLQANDYA
jgi:hypothetical protein